MRHASFPWFTLFALALGACGDDADTGNGAGNGTGNGSNGGSTIPSGVTVTYDGSTFTEESTNVCVVAAAADAAAFQVTTLPTVTTNDIELFVRLTTDGGRLLDRETLTSVDVDVGAQLRRPDFEEGILHYVGNFASEPDPYRCPATISYVRDGVFGGTGFVYRIQVACAGPVPYFEFDSANLMAGPSGTVSNLEADFECFVVEGPG